MKVSTETAGVAQSLLMTFGASLPDRTKQDLIDISAAYAYDVETSDQLVEGWTSQVVMLVNVFTPPEPEPAAGEATATAEET